jgi:hypothetical protein
MDSEKSNIIVELQKTIVSVSSISLSEDDAFKLSAVLVDTYKISGYKGLVKETKDETIKVYENPLKMENFHPAETIKQATPEISDEERDKIMEEAISKKYGIVVSKDITSVSGVIEDETYGIKLDEDPYDALLSANPTLEKMRLEKLQKQKHNMNSGNPNAFRRSQ